MDRVLLKPGSNTIRHDALVAVSSQFEVLPWNEPPTPVERLPLSLLRYTLPSRYCDSDKLLDFAARNFGTCAPGAPTVRAICDWIHNNIEYRYGSGCPDIAASDTIANRYGVCRDFAHAAIALCRTFNIPARYVTGHLPDIAFQDPGTSMDFHAYMEVYLGGEWHTFDARFNTPRVGRVKIACGMDAVDGAFTTIYGSAWLTSFQVWAYQVGPVTDFYRRSGGFGAAVGWHAADPLARAERCPQTGLEACEGAGLRSGEPPHVIGLIMRMAAALIFAILAYAEVAGTFSGTWTSGANGPGGDIRIAFTPAPPGEYQARSSFTYQSQEVKTTPVSAKVDGNQVVVVFQYDLGGAKLQSTMRGTLTGDKIQGKYVSQATEGGQVVDEGTWAATRK